MEKSRLKPKNVTNLRTLLYYVCRRMIVCPEFLNSRFLLYIALYNSYCLTAKHNLESFNVTLSIYLAMPFIFAASASPKVAFLACTNTLHGIFANLIHAFFVWTLMFVFLKVYIKEQNYWFILTIFFLSFNFVGFLIQYVLWFVFKFSLHVVIKYLLSFGLPILPLFCFPSGK